MAFTEAPKKKKVFRNPFKKKKVIVPVAPKTPERPPKKVLMIDTPGGISAMTANSVNRTPGLLPGMTEDATEVYVFEDDISPKEIKRSKPTIPSKNTFLSRSKWFQKLSDNAFDLVDQDGSGCVDEKELYSGLLLIHLKLGSYAGPAACKVRVDICPAVSLLWISYCS